MILKASTEGLGVFRLASQFFARIHVDALDCAAVDRGRQIVDHRVEQRLNALVLEGRAAELRDGTRSDGQHLRTSDLSVATSGSWPSR